MRYAKGTPAPVSGENGNLLSAPCTRTARPDIDGITGHAMRLDSTATSSTRASTRLQKKVRIDHATSKGPTMTATYRGCSTIDEVEASDHWQYIFDAETIDFVDKTNLVLEKRNLTLAFVEKCGRCSRTAMAHQLFEHYCGTGDLCPDKGGLRVTVWTVDGHDYDLSFQSLDKPPGLPGRTLHGDAYSTQLPWLTEMFLEAARVLSVIARDYVERNQGDYKEYEDGRKLLCRTTFQGLWMKVTTGARSR